MYGKTVKVKLPNTGVTIEVFVCCTPSTPKEEVIKRALQQLKNDIVNAACIV